MIRACSCTANVTARLAGDFGLDADRYTLPGAEGPFVRSALCELVGMDDEAVCEGVWGGRTGVI